MDMDDEFEIEVTDLNSGVTSRLRLAGSPAGSPVAPPTTETDPWFAVEDDTSGGDEPPVIPRRSRSQRQMRAAIVSGVVLVAVVLMFAFNPTAMSALGTALRLPTPVPTATTIPGIDVVYLLRGAPWATITLDDKQPSNVSFDVGLTILRLPPGRHTLSVSQTPFPPLRCTISAPAASRDTCPLTPPLNANTPELGGLSDVLPGSRGVDLGARFDRLSQADRDGLVKAIAASVQLEQSTQVATFQPGDHYLRDDGSIAEARYPLQGRLVETLIPPQNSMPSDDELCTSFCDIQGGVAVTENGSWAIQVVLSGTWHITDSVGNVVVDHAPMTPTGPSNQGTGPYQVIGPSDQFTEIGVRWVGSWQVTPTMGFTLPKYSLCQPAVNIVSNAFLNNIIPDGYDVECLDNSPVPDVAVVTIQPTSGAADHLIYHFGVLAAVDEAAHAAFPRLPMASPHERLLAQKILGAQPG